MKKILSVLLCAVFYFPVFTQNLDHVQGDLLVQLKEGLDVRKIVNGLSTFQGVPTKIKVEKSASAPLRIWLLHFDWTVIDERAFLNHVKQQPGVLLAQLNHIITLRETVPNDPNFASQWQWVNTGQGGGTPDADVDADLAWDITTGGTTATGHDIVVCVLEGTNRNNPDLQGNLWVNIHETPNNGIDEDNNGYVDDYDGWNTVTDNDNIPSQQHGTQVSGMIGATGNNSMFVTGINWNVKIMHVEFGGITEANVVEAYTYPLLQRSRFNQSGGTEGAFVVATNASWGIDGGDPADSPLWCSFYDVLGLEGVLSCGATANNNVNIDQVLDLPTACASEYMVAVTATNNNDVRTFSGYGTTHIDVAAPGGGIVTLSTNGGPSTTSGTSFASPLTAGIIALLYSVPCTNLAELALADPAAAAQQVRDALFAGVDVKPNLVNETKYGGRVNAFNSLNLLLQDCGPCPKPYNVEAEDILDVSTTIHWNSPDSSIATDLRYRMVGTNDWVTLTNISSPFALEGLLACTEYEFQLQEICISDSSGFANAVVFKTDGCCVAPANPTLTDINMETALFSWESVFAANSYNVLLITAQGDTITENTSETIFHLTNLVPCTDYQVLVQTLCSAGGIESTEPISFTTLGCGTCQDLSYCASAGLDTEYEWIENVSLGFINNSSGNNNGYGDFTGTSGLTTELLTFTSNTISLTPGYSAAGTFPEWFTVYIDFNQDGDFNDVNEKAFDTGATVSTTVTGNIVVPGTAQPGTTRMRVVMRWNSAPAGPCAASFPNGEVEDYCVNINPGSAPNCIMPNALEITDTTTTTSAVTWEAVPDADGYTLQYRKVGINGWTTKVAPNNNILLEQLEICKEYEVHVRSNCTGIASDYSNSIFFSTLCINSTSDELAAALSLSISPNPFEETFSISFKLDVAQEINLQIVDVCGRVMEEQKQLLFTGNHQLKFSPTLASGVYFVKIRLQNGEVTKIILRM